MAESNHELTDSEAQAFQPEPHVLHLIKRKAPGASVPHSKPDEPADAPEGSKESR